MVKALKYSLIFLIVSAILISGGVSYCDDSAQDVKVFRGQVMEVDWVGSMITVDGGDEVTFYVPPGMKIRHGTEMASLSDINQEDYVTVRYTDTQSGTPKAVSITLNKSYPEF